MVLAVACFSAVTAALGVERDLLACRSLLFDDVVFFSERG